MTDTSSLSNPYGKWDQNQLHLEFVANDTYHCKLETKYLCFNESNCLSASASGSMWCTLSGFFR